MHLVGPWLSTTGKKKGKKKWASAEHKRRAELAQQQQQALYQAHGIAAKKAKPAANNRTALVGLANNNTRYQDHIKQEVVSHEPTWAVCAKPHTPRYTGTRIIGIAVLHKSCLQPVSSQKEAEEISKMRRN